MHSVSHPPKVRKVSRRRCAAVAAGLIALIARAFWPVHQNDFIVYDDPSYVTENPFVTDGLTEASFRWAFTAMHSSNWHPLTWLSHMLDCQLFGPNFVIIADNARDRATVQGQREIAQKNAELLDLYRSGKAFHQTP
jgi:hypothetical protein